MEAKRETRNLGIKGFRNIGFKSESETEERLILNYSLSQDYIGDLVILIGPNNAGKSNVLAAISAWSANDYDNKRNVSDVFMIDKMRHPLVQLFTIIDDKRTLIKPKVSTIVNNENKLKPKTTKKLNAINNKTNFDLNEYLPVHEGNKWKYKIGKNGYINMIKFAKNIIWNNLKKEDLKALPLDVYSPDFFPDLNNQNKIHANAIFVNNNNQLENTNQSERLYVEIKNLFETIIQFEKEKATNPNLAKLISQLTENPWINGFIMDYENWCGQNKQNDEAPKLTTETINKQANNEKTNLAIDFAKYAPNVIQYEEHHINNKDLICNATDLAHNTFFNAVLKMMGSDIEELKTTYDQVEELDNRSLLVSESNKLTKKLSKITNYFNELYCLEHDHNKYQFSLQLNANDICFYIFKLDQAKPDEPIPLFLDHQSTGFRWFFDLFFNVFATNALQPGDIIIMDEPAINLHVYAQRELRKFLKEFAINHAITFVIATHCPFLVDLDYLDEIRIISSHDQNIACIENNFSVINAKHDPDSLASIRKSLTVINNVIIGEDQIVVFVEGITDYNYLTAMKNWLSDTKYQQLTFLPIQGLGEDTQDMKSRLDKLQNIHHLNSILLTDGDYAGQEFAQLNSETSHPFRLLSLNKLGFEEIEDLFASKDQAKFNIIKETNKNDKEKWNKNTVSSVILKKILYKDSLNPIAKEITEEEDRIITSQTQDNFKKVFDAIIDLVRKPN